jgi:VWFA-related protein
LLRLLLTGLAFVVVTAAPYAQQGPAQTRVPTFKGGVRVIAMDAFVRDKDDNFVTGLTSADFEVVEDERLQQIASVSMVNLPVDRRGRPVPVESDDRTLSVAPGSTDDVGRVYVMILNSGDAERVRRIAHEFLDEFLGSTDLMVVLHGNRAVTQGLTNDKEVLRAAVDRYQGSGGKVLTLIKDIAVNLNALGGRRKAILYVGDEYGIRREDAPGAVSESSRAMQRDYDEAVRMAVRNNVRIYPIDPRGFLVRFSDLTGSAAAARPPSVPARPGAPPENEPTPFLGPVASGLGEGMDARIIASQTGGLAIVNTSNYRGNFDNIVRDHSSYYVVAFYSTAPADGEMHPVRIRVKGRPDLTVRARSGYRATTPDVKGREVKLPNGLSVGARDALRGAAPVSAGLPVELFTGVFRGENFDGSLLIGCHVPGATLKLGAKDRIELSYAAIDRWGTVRAAERRSFTLTFTDSTRARVQQSGLRLFGRARLPRGTYQIRVAVNQPDGATGSATTEVEIPDYTELPVSISDLVVSSSEGKTLMTLEDDPVLRRALPAQPTANRQFRPAETMSVFGEIYNSQWVLTPSIGVTTVVQSESGRVMMRGEQTLMSGDRGRVYYQSHIPLERLAQGSYVLTLEAYTRQGFPASASQQLRFEVSD